MVKQRIVFATGLALALSALVPLSSRVVHAFADTPATIALNTSGVQPRQVEETTLQSASRVYGKAWQDLGTALANNNVSALSSSFVGFARERYTTQARQQAEAGIATRLTPLSHNAKVEFYSVDGSSMQVRDDVQLKTEVMDGSKVVASQTATVPYVAILTVVDDGWRVRILEQAQQ